LALLESELSASTATPATGPQANPATAGAGSPVFPANPAIQDPKGIPAPAAGGAAAATPTATAATTPAAPLPVHGPSDCPTPWENDGPYHPDGYEEGAVHGIAAKLLQDTCTNCHDQDLQGCAKAPSCDSCHEAGWRTDCTYCHGGQADQTGAPPRDVDGASSAISFIAHSVHVDGGIHAPFQCSQCHDAPTDVLSPGHMFDSTPGSAEVDFARGLSAGGSYASSTGTCNDNYCHGNGRETGSYSDLSGPTECNSCHGYNEDPQRLSGQHAAHIQGGLLAFLLPTSICSDCHSRVVDAEGQVIAPELHVNGEVNLDLPSTITYNGSTCDGSCHNTSHSGLISSW